MNIKEAIKDLLKSPIVLADAIYNLEHVIKEEHNKIRRDIWCMKDAFIKSQRLPCFIEGEGRTYIEAGETKKEIECNISAPGIYLGPGEEGIFRIQPQYPIKRAIFRINAPFTITDLLIGHYSQLTSYGADCRKVYCSTVCNVGNIIQVSVRYPKDMAPQ